MCEWVHSFRSFLSRVRGTFSWKKHCLSSGSSQPGLHVRINCQVFQHSVAQGNRNILGLTSRHWGFWEIPPQLILVWNQGWEPWSKAVKGKHLSMWRSKAGILNAGCTLESHEKVFGGAGEYQVNWGKFAWCTVHLFVQFCEFRQMHIVL